MTTRTRVVLLSVMTALWLLPAQGAEPGDQRQVAREHIERARPSDVVIDSLEFGDRQIVLRAHTPHVNNAGNFAENLKADPLFTVPVVSYVYARKDSEPKVYDFEYRFSIKQ